MQFVRRRLIPPPEVDIARGFRHANYLEARVSALAPWFDPEFECAIVMPGQAEGERRTYRGLQGLQAAWLDWLEPWVSYHTRTERLIDLGDRVLALLRDRGRPTGMEREIESSVAAIWTVRQGKALRAEFYASRADALEAAGLHDDPAHT